MNRSIYYMFRISFRGKIFINMFVVAEPIERPDSLFTIVHNDVEYPVDSYKMRETSKFFQKIISKKNDPDFKKMTIKDMHSESAFGSFIKLCNYERCIIDFEDQVEVASLLDEWQCPEVQASFSTIFSKQPLFEKKSTPFKEIPHDQPIEEKKKITVSNSGWQETAKTSEEKEEFVGQSDKNPQTPENPPKTNEQQTQIKTIKVHVKSRTGSLYSIQIFNNQTVDALKKMIMIKTGIDVAKQVLIYNGQKLNSEDTLMSYGINSKCSIYLEKTDPNEKKEIIITLKHQTKNDVFYLISPTKKVNELLLSIKAKERLDCPVNVMLNGKVLEKDKTLQECGITENTDLLLLCSE